MGAFLSVDDARRVLYVRFEGILTDEVLLSRYLQVREWNAAHGFLSVIVDFSHISGERVTARAVRNVSELLPRIPSDIQRAVILLAPQDEVYGMVRMFAMLASDIRENVHVVRTLAEAYMLVGVESLELRPLIEW